MKLFRTLMLITLFAVPAGGMAQQRAPHSNVISLNPFLFIGGWYNAEFEHSVSPNTTLGARGSLVTLDDDVDYVSGRAFVRYYPTTAFRGFFLGIDAGVTSLKEDNDAGDHTVFGAGFELGYNWLLGSQQKLYLSLGAGADRLFGNDLDDFTVVLPTIRIVNVGIAF